MKERQLKLFYNNQTKKGLPNKRRIIEIPLDTLILTSIIIIFGVVFLFSLGVKRGKKLSHTVGLNQYTIHNTQLKKTLLVQAKNITTKKDGKEAKDNKGKYIIRVASYLKESAAKREEKYLKQKGFSAKLLKKGKYTVIYVGKFINKKEAERAKNFLRKKYKDCFIRRL